MMMKITITLENNEKIVTRNLTKKMVCALFDLQYMLDDNIWKTAKLNNMDKDLEKAFKAIEYIDKKMHDMDTVLQKKIKKHLLKNGKEKT